MAVTTVFGSAAAFDWQAFQRALLVGACAVFVSGVIAVNLRKPRPGTMGIPMAAAILGTLRWQLSGPGAPVAIIVASVLGGLAAEAIAKAPPRFQPMVFFSIVPSVVAFVVASPPGLTLGARIGCAAGAATSLVVFADFDRRHERDGLVIPMLIATCVLPLIVARASIPGAGLVGAVVLFIVLWIPKPQARLGDAGAGAIAIAYWWCVALVAQNSGPHIVGAFVALGFLALEPANRLVVPATLRRALRQNDRDSRWMVAATAVIAQIFVVAYAGAVSGTRETLDVALFTVVPVALIGGLLAGVIVPMPRRRKSRSDSG